MAEETYLMQRSKLVDLERSLQPKVEESKGAISIQPFPARRIALPKIQFPQFSGKYEDWPAFRDHFKSTIDSNDLLPPIEKLYYLRSCVQGEAASMIRNLPATEASYKKAWKELADFFENTRLLVQSYISKFLSLQKMKNESAADLKKIFHGMVNTYDSLENLRRPVSSSEDLYVHLIVDLFGPRTRDLWDEHISNSIDPPTYETLKTFLQRRLQTLDGRLAAKEAKFEASPSKSSNKTVKSHIAQRGECRKSPKERCTMCQKDHFLMFCADFKDKSATEKREHVSEKKLCLNCLGKHRVSECASKKSCTVCNERHHTMLHDACREKGKENTEATTLHVARNRIEKPITILLATARVRVADKHGTMHQVRALVDQGSETSFISEVLAQRLKLTRRHASVAVIGVNGSQTGVARGRVTFQLKSHFDDAALVINALVLPRLSVYSGGSNVVSRKWHHLEGLVLADPNFLESEPVDVLLGADVFCAIIETGVKRGSPDEPIAQKTTLGWIISGGVTANVDSTSKKTCAYQCIQTESLVELVRKFWEQEELPSVPTLTENEKRCEHFFVATHTRTEDGRYMVRLPPVD